jgi:hypothetical protein
MCRSIRSCRPRPGEGTRLARIRGAYAGCSPAESPALAGPRQYPAARHRAKDSTDALGHDDRPVEADAGVQVRLQEEAFKALIAGRTEGRDRYADSHCDEDRALADNPRLPTNLAELWSYAITGASASDCAKISLASCITNRRGFAQIRIKVTLWTKLHYTTLIFRLRRIG